jgi:hypothetical protein
MNLRVDLIDDSERRSASLLNMKSMMRIGSFVVPSVFLLLIVIQAINTIRVKNELGVLESQWESALPRKQQAQKVREELLRNEALVAELDGWKKAMVPWDEQLLGLMLAAPPNVQFRQLRLSHHLQLIDDKAPARFYAMDIEGRAVGDLAEQSVQLLRRRVQEGDMFTGRVDTVVVSQFGADTAEAARKTDRTFAIQATYLPMEFE